MSEPSSLQGDPVKVALHVTLEAGRILTFETNLPFGSPLAFMNEHLDKFNRAADRLKIRYGLVEQEARLHHERAKLKHLTSDFMRIQMREEAEQEKWVNSSRRGEWKRKETEQAQFEQAKMNIENQTALVKNLEMAFEEAKAMAA